MEVTSFCVGDFMYLCVCACAGVCVAWHGVCVVGVFPVWLITVVWRRLATTLHQPTPVGRIIVHYAGSDCGKLL